MQFFLLHSGLWQTGIDWDQAGSAFRDASLSARLTGACSLRSHPQQTGLPSKLLTKVMPLINLAIFFLYDTSFVLNFGVKSNVADNSLCKPEEPPSWIGASQLQLSWQRGGTLCFQRGFSVPQSTWKHSSWCLINCMPTVTLPDCEDGKGLQTQPVRVFSWRQAEGEQSRLLVHEVCSFRIVFMIMFPLFRTCELLERQAPF